jgi:REP element-mobilizing transposase RayT
LSVIKARSDKENLVRFGSREKQVVEQAIKDEAEKRGLRLYAIAVCSNHVHVVFGYCEKSIGGVVRQFKQAGSYGG